MESTQNNSTSLVVIDEINKAIAHADEHYQVPMAKIFGKGIMTKQESFGGLTFQENAHRTDLALQNMEDLPKIWNHSHSQWTWRHINLSYHSPWKNMRQIAAEITRKKQALNEAKWRAVENEIKIRKLEEELEDLLSDTSTDKYWKTVEKKVELAKMREGIIEGTMYIEGAMKDVLALNELYEQLKSKVSNFSEEDFEKAESKTHLKRSIIQCIRDVRQAGGISKGEQEYLEQIGVNPAKMSMVLRGYVEQEAKSDSWDTDMLFKFVDKIVDDLIDNHKVDVKRMAAMGFESETVPGISYDKKIATDGRQHT